MATPVDQKLLRQTKFPPEFSQKVDMKKVNVEVMKKWIAGKISEILGSEDDVVIELCFNLLEGSRFPDIKALQISLTGFLDKDTPKFCKELWGLCLSAQTNPQGVPKELLEAKKLELIQEKIDAEKAAEEAKSRKDQEQIRERDVDSIRQRERADRGRGIQDRLLLLHLLVADALHIEDLHPAARQTLTFPVAGEEDEPMVEDVHPPRVERVERMRHHLDPDHEATEVELRLFDDGRGQGPRVKAGQDHLFPGRQEGWQRTLNHPVKDAHDLQHVLIYHAHDRLEEDVFEVVRYLPSAGVQLLGAIDIVEIGPTHPRHQGQGQGRAIGEEVMEGVTDVTGDLPLILPMIGEATSALIFLKAAKPTMIGA
ncbi:uncharacterized protein Z518_01401 [Rhinocladiella mackenziei CBS 650.93]|uniref:PWI domain-containing protein n=1 Tax=Rhinocladiella mackenziei CBS 650.93 TaxID=1442369 RepID=A0A0D2IWB2_9EURO|nr:uncharacterized protein Z518_01401 [Rhinocladiella mackenziei CBS 650.93]KIX10319.1 hypothetical protein Z518_01401 [Rhinocladiella mackenziei CBS 650.93]